MNLIKAFSAISGLASVKRYSMLPLSRDESVLEHIAAVAIISLLLAREINERIGVNRIDCREVLHKALIHDIDELVVGDIPRTTKYASIEIRDMFRRIESDGVRKVLKEMDLSRSVMESLAADHTDAKRSITGLIVAVADSLCVVCKVWQEALVCGNLSMVKIADGVRLTIKNLKGMALSYQTLSPAHDFLTDVLSQADMLMEQAAAKDDPVHGAIREEMVL